MNPTEFRTRNNAKEAALCAVGISRPEETLNEAAAELGKFQAILVKRFMAQAAYDVLTNQAVGLVENKDIPAHAMKVALVAAVAEYVQWEGERVFDFAADLLEDANFESVP